MKTRSNVWVLFTLGGVLVIATTLLLCSAIPAKSFKTTQLEFERVKDAYEEKEIVTQKLFSDKGLTINQSEIFLRVFKKEKQLELWAKEKGVNKTFQLLKTYKICSASGELGPKRKLGDYQVPEGFYVINRWNPVSNFHLSLGINYPNASDRILSDKKHPGDDIFIHGNCVSIGCMAMTDPMIKEIYIAFVEAKNAGQGLVPVHIFPSKLDDSSWDSLQAAALDDPSLLAFWKNLKPGYEWFENKKTLPKVNVDTKGRYSFQ
ncbi:L,D-transpeptidase family protein [Xanthocytophaga flava]|uniref:L,D-transpeptidase family protein n=1 Tax=Xanthocytophaga flava TaxID=3048013 RepID=UPI0028D05E25|nr:L,D-transpeptidase family protein [Xanthocytophaga flavus]MDJ1466411.1 L,D-transpeptidase family protein [Xanthocytophaga flavus]